MTTIELPDSPLAAVDLELHERRTLGAHDGAPAIHRNRVHLGLPLVSPLDETTVDEDARLFLRSRPGSRFYLLALRASFEPSEEFPLASAWVDVTLSAVTPAPRPPVAWSMKPREASDVAVQTRKVTLGASLKLTAGPPGLGLEAGPEAGTERQLTHDVELVSVEALREGTETPRWTFYPTAVRQIRGVFDLTLVVDLEAETRGAARIDVGATVQARDRGFLRKRYRATRADPDREQVLIPPSSPPASPGVGLR
jgi:hypothetical protein